MPAINTALLPDCYTEEISVDQRRMWTFDRMDGSGQTDFQLLAYSISGLLNVEALQAAIRGVTLTHEILRTAYPGVDGQPKLNILAADEFQLQISDVCRDLRSGEIDAEKLLLAEESRAFSLETGPLIRYTLYPSSDREFHIFIVAVHHMVADGASLGIFENELSSLYSRYLEHEQEMQTNEIRYRDYAATEYSWLKTADAQKHLQFWKSRLAGPRELDLHFIDRNFNSTSNDVLELPVQFHSSAVLEISEFARKLRVTRSMFYMGVFALLLRRYSHESDLVIGTSAARRLDPELEKVIGCFANLLPVRIPIDAQSSVRLFFSRMRESFLASFAHQRMPYSQIVDSLNVQRRWGRNPLFDVFFAYNNFRSRPLKLVGTTVEDIPWSTRRTPFQLELHLYDCGSEVRGRLIFPKVFTDTAAAAVFARHYENLVGSVLNYPDLAICDLELLTDGERNRLVKRDSKVGLPQPMATCVHYWFEAVADDNDNCAVRMNDCQLTYRELNEKANQLGSYLRKAGIGPGALVAIYLRRSLDLLVAITGVLKSGAAYLPLDPVYPRDRLEFILADSRAGAVLTTKELGSKLSDRTAKIVCLDLNSEAICQEPVQNLPHISSPDDLAYAIYTSGSTGKPKGVLITHHNVVRLFSVSKDFFNICQEDVWTLFHSFAFDFSVWEIWGALLFGGRLIVVPEEAVRSSDKFLKLLRDERVTFINQTPSAFYGLMREEEAAEPNALDSLRVVAFGGESLDVGQLRSWFDRHGDTRPQLINMYGITETTVNTTYRRITAADAAANPAPNMVGHPMPDLEAYVLDEYQQFVPIGVSGEIYIAGEGIARGYLHRPGLTAQRFIPDPFSGSPGARLYRTGDIGRLSRNLDIEFLGRADLQIKIRGFRVEIGEIESALREFPTVERTVVVAGHDSEHGKKLIAYYVSPLELDVARLHGFLERKLPSYMVPHSFVRIDSLPLNAHGKIDRGALPEVIATASSSSVEYAEPRTDVERHVAAIWADLLGVIRVGRNDNFFELGGHSLIATRVVARIRKVLQVYISLQALFEQPNLADFCKEIDRLRAAGATGEGTRSVPHKKPTSNRFAPFPLTELQRAMWIGEAQGIELGGTATYSYLEVRWPNLELYRFEVALNKLIRRHDMLRAIVRGDGNQQVLAAVEEYKLQVLDVIGVPETKRQELLGLLRDEMSHISFTADKWPLFDIRLSQESKDSFRVHVAFSGLLVDGTSQNILFRDLMAFYNDPNCEPPQVGFSFREYVDFIEEEKRSAAYKTALQFWEEKVQRPLGPPELPTAVEPSAIVSPSFSRKCWTIEKEEWSVVKVLAARKGLSSPTVLLAAFTRVLAMWSKAPEFLINVVRYNRPPVHHDIRHVVGNFSSPLIYFANCSKYSDFFSHARQTQLELWKAIDHSMVDGVQVLRMVSRSQGAGSRNLAPVVFVCDLEQPQQRNDAQFEIDFGSLQASQVWLESHITEVNDGLSIQWDWISELFPSDVIHDMGKSLSEVIAGLADPMTWEDRNLAPLPPAHQQFIAAFNNTSVENRPRLLHDLFRENALTKPDSTAIVANTSILSYGQLHHAACVLAGSIRRLGLTSRQPLAVAIGKGWQQVVAALGALYAGHPYVPLDPSQPKSRLLEVAQDAQIALALVGPEEAPFSSDLKTMPVDDACLSGETDSYSCDWSPSEVAYLIYTSGSTGRPKGVMISHSAASNTIEDINARFSIDTRDRVLALSNLTFDLSVYDIFGLLAAGGAIVFPDRDKEREPSHWGELINRFRVTLWNSVPALFEMFVENELGPEEPVASSYDTMRTILLSGDWIPVTLPKKAMALCPSARIVSLGGATEASIWSIFYPIIAVDPSWKSIPYGRPLRNQKIYILDQNLGSKPVGVPGEICIGGDGLAKGYWHDLQRTKASFVDYGVTKEKVYRTGDWGKYDWRGYVEFLGRSDLQVKVNGYRIEIGDIESALLMCPQVKQGAVIAAETSAGNKQLCAFVVLADGQRFDRETIGRQLRESLPQYMVPPVINEISRLPLNVNGKIDRAALVALSSQSSREKSQADLPATEAESVISSIWCDLLNVHAVSRTDNFFAIGGDSISATRLLSTIKKRYRVTIKLKDFFERPTIAELSSLIESSLNSSSTLAPSEMHAMQTPEKVSVHVLLQNLK